jgi:SHS2 domain-containing protein
MTERQWQLFPHGADVGIRGLGPTKAAAFEEAALAMTAAITDPEDVQPATKVEIACAAPDDGILLVDWLNALVFEMATRGLIFGAFEVTIADGALTATAAGERVDPARHHPAAEVKGATLTELDVHQNADGGWCAQCVIDV